MPVGGHNMIYGIIGMLILAVMVFSRLFNLSFLPYTLRIFFELSVITISLLLFGKTFNEGVWVYLAKKAEIPAELLNMTEEQAQHTMLAVLVITISMALMLLILLIDIVGSKQEEHWLYQDVDRTMRALDITQRKVASLIKGCTYLFMLASVVFLIYLNRFLDEFTVLAARITNLSIKNVFDVSFDIHNESVDALREDVLLSGKSLLGTVVTPTLTIAVQLFFLIIMLIAVGVTKSKAKKQKANEKK